MVHAPLPPQTDAIHRLGQDAKAEMRELGKDQYAEVPTHEEMVGKRFKVVLKPNFNAGFLVFYKDGVLHVSNDVQESAFKDDIFYKLEVDGSYQRTGSYTAVNAFGATTDVEEAVTSTLSIAESKFPDDADINLRLDLPLSGPAAKKLSAEVRLVVEGTVAKLLNGKVAYCEESYLRATLSSPLSVRDVDCDVGAHVTRIAYEDVFGKVLKEWSSQISWNIPPKR